MSTVIQKYLQWMKNLMFDFYEDHKKNPNEGLMLIMDDKRLSCKHVAEMLEVTASCVANWRSKKEPRKMNKTFLLTLCHKVSHLT